MKITIRPSVPTGTVWAPPSKSMAHRMLLCAGCAQGDSTIENIDLSQDILATMDCLTALGAEVQYENKSVRVKGISMRDFSAPATLQCRECGSTLRFFIPLCLLSNQKMSLAGSETLMGRPQSVYEDLCAEQGLHFHRTKSCVEVAGPLRAGRFEFPGNISSQFVSGLLFALPLLPEDSRICLIPPVESRPYIEMTRQAQALFGVVSEWEDACTLHIPGNQCYQAGNTRVEGDYSNAAFFEALNLAGGNVQVKGLNENSLQGDRIYKKHLEQLDRGHAVIDLSDCPDLGPVLMAAAALRHGAHFTGTERLKIKESDRGEAMRQELAKLGIPVQISDNEIEVGVPAQISNNEIEVNSEAHAPEESLSGHNDHRIVMALAVLLTKTGGSIDGAEAVAKSLPDFWDRMKELGVQMESVS